MNRIKKISALILFIPVLSILLHNLLPHHHHDNCISESHDSICGLDKEEHQHASTHYDICEHCDLFESHQHQNEDCHLSDIFKIEKSTIQLGFSISFSFLYPDDSRIFINKPDIKLQVVSPCLQLYYSRGPPKV